MIEKVSKVKIQNKTNTPAATNGQAVPTCDELIEQYERYRDETAGNFVYLSRTVICAKERLSPDDFRRFAKEVCPEHIPLMFGGLIKAAKSVFKKCNVM